MKISVICHKCLFENSQRQARVEGFISIQEEDLYHFKCANGHDNLLEIQALKFEILFESGLCAIKDKYYLESVLSLTAALERFNEFFIKVILRVNGLENENTEAIYKIMSKQSERQLGAFITLYSSTFKELPILLAPKFVEFRNNVVHKGYFPHEDEVINYAEEIFNVIRHSYLKILINYNELVFDVLFENSKLRRKKFKNIIETIKVPISKLAPAFVLSHSINTQEFIDTNFRESFEIVKKTKFYG